MGADRAEYWRWSGVQTLLPPQSGGDLCRGCSRISSRGIDENIERSDLPITNDDHIVKSVKVDLLASKRPGRTEWLGAIGVYSPFHESYGYYADPVDDKTAILPKGWKGRLVNLSPGDTEGVKGLCLEPHDLAIAKYAASREKDLIFNREFAKRGLLSQSRLLSLLDQTPIDEEARERIRGQIGRDFSA